MKLQGTDLKAPVLWMDYNESCPDHMPFLEDRSSVNLHNSNSLVYFCSPNITPHSTTHLCPLKNNLEQVNIVSC